MEWGRFISSMLSLFWVLSVRTREATMETDSRAWGPPGWSYLCSESQAAPPLLSSHTWPSCRDGCRQAMMQTYSWTQLRPQTYRPGLEWNEGATRGPGRQEASKIAPNWECLGRRSCKARSVSGVWVGGWPELDSWFLKSLTSEKWLEVALTRWVSING